MNRQEYTNWANDFRRMLPDTGAWLFSQPQETRDTWFDEVFSSLELRDAKAASLKIMETGIANFERERLPAIVTKHCAEIAYARRENERKAQERKRMRLPRGASKSDALQAKFDVCMKSCCIAIEQQNIDEDQRREFIDEYFDAHDTVPDNEHNQPRYTCLECLDSGFAPVRGRLNMVGHCKCDKGQVRAETKWRTGRQIGPYATEARANYVETFDDGAW